MSFSSQNEIRRAAWQQPAAPTLPVISIASLLTHPPHVTPIYPPATAAPPVGVPPPVGCPPPTSAPLPNDVTSHVYGPLPVGVLPSVGVPLPVPVGMQPSIGVPPPAFNSMLPPSRFMAGFGHTLPAPAFIPPLSSADITSVTNTPPIPVSCAAEDMDLENSASSEDELGEGFDEEWPICSHQTSSRSRGRSQHSTVFHNQDIQLNESRVSDNNLYSSLQEKQHIQSNDYLRAVVEQPHTRHMYDTSLPIIHNNFAISSAPFDLTNRIPLPATIASVAFVGGTELVRSLVSLPAQTTRVPALVNPTSGSILKGPSDVDFRTSSYGSDMIPVGQLQHSAPMKVVPPAMPPLTRPPMSLQHVVGAVRPFIESSLTLPTNSCAKIVSSGFSSPVSVTEIPHRVVGPRLGSIIYPDSVRMSGTPQFVLSIASNIPGPSNAAISHGMLTGIIQSPDDTSVGPRFVHPVPIGRYEPANARPLSQQGLKKQDNMTANPTASRIGMVNGQISSGGPVLGSGLIGSSSGEPPNCFVAGSTLPVNSNSVSSREVVDSVVTPDCIRLNLQCEALEVGAPVPNYILAGVNSTGQHPESLVPQIPPLLHSHLAMHNLPGQFPGLPLEHKASSSDQSERVLNALHNLAGMQTDPPQNCPPHGTNITNTRFGCIPVESVGAGVRQMAPSLNQNLFGPRVDTVSGFGSSLVRSLPQQSRTDEVCYSLPRDGLPAPLRLSTGQGHFPLPGNFQFYSFYPVWQKLHPFYFLNNCKTTFYVDNFWDAE